MDADELKQKTRLHHLHLISGRGSTGTAIQRYTQYESKAVFQ